MHSVPVDVSGQATLQAHANCHAHELVRRIGEPLLGGNRVTLLPGAQAARDAQFSAIAAAADHINIACNLVEAQAWADGDELARRLVDRCRAGVRVNLLFDSVGPLRGAGRFLDSLRRAGVSLCEHRPVRRWQLRLGGALQARQPGAHDLAVIDGRTAFIGGFDPGAQSGDGDDGDDGGAVAAQTQPQVQPQVQLEGPVLQRLQRQFIAHWQHVASGPMQQARYFPALRPAGRQRVGLAPWRAGSGTNPGHAALLGALATARSTILLAASGGPLPRAVMQALLAAAARGVRTELLLDHAAGAQAGRLQAAGVGVTVGPAAGLAGDGGPAGTPRVRACVIDGVWSSVGTELQPAALHSPHAGLVVLDEDFAAALQQRLRDGALRAGQQPALPPQSGAARWPRWPQSLARGAAFFR